MTSAATEPAAAFLQSLLEGGPPDAIGTAPLSTHLARLRAEALERAHALGLPGVRDEDWRFSDPVALYRQAFRCIEPGVTPPAAAISSWLIPQAAALLVFVDGRFAPGLSRTADAGALRALPFAAAGDAPLHEHLGRVAGFGNDAFRAINTARLHDGALVAVARDARIAGAVQVLHLAVGEGAAAQPRLLVLAEPGSELLIVEQYASLTAQAYLVNAVTEVHAAEGSRVRHIRVQEESDAAFHVASLAARIGRDAAWESVSVSLGARWSRLAIEAQIAGSGASAVLDGLALAGGRQLADTHSFVDHAVPHSRSRQLHKCVADGAGRVVFNGRVLVRRDAQQTDSAQQSRTLLLSPRAHVDAKPQLEILADDVKCSHGATVGQLDADELFYLRSRGFSESAARALLTEGFAGEIVDRIAVPALAARLRAAVVARAHAAVEGA